MYTYTLCYVYRILYIPISHLMQQCVCNCSDNEQLFSLFRLPFCSPFFSLPGASVDLCLFFLFFLCFFSACFSVCIRFAVTVYVCVCICYAKRPQSVVFDMCAWFPFKQISLQRTRVASPTAMPSAPSATPLSPLCLPSCSPLSAGEYFGHTNWKCILKQLSAAPKRPRARNYIIQPSRIIVVPDIDRRGRGHDRGGGVKPTEVDRILHTHTPTHTHMQTHMQTHAWTTLKSLFAFS